MLLLRQAFHSCVDQNREPILSPPQWDSGKSTCLLCGGLSWNLQRSLAAEVSTVALPSLLPLLKLSRDAAEVESLASASLAPSDRRRLDSRLKSFLLNLSTAKHWILSVQSPLMMKRFRLLSNKENRQSITACSLLRLLLLRISYLTTLGREM